VRYAQSTVKGENVGGLQVADGTITEEQFRATVARAREERIGIGEALAVSGLLSYEALEKAMRRQVEEVCVTAFNWTDGTFKFAPGSTDKIQDVRHDPLVLLFTSCKRFLSAEQAKAFLAPLGKGTISRGADFDRSLFTMRSVFPGEAVTPMISGRLTVSDVLARARPDDLALLATLVQMHLAVVVGAEAPKAAAPVKKGPARSHSPEEEGAREQINAEFERVKSSTTLYGVLRLQKGASIEEVKASYLTLAKRFHADSFSQLDLGDATETLRELFAKISEAHATLADPKRREEYTVLLERQEAGLPTDVEVIFKAEGHFNRGDALIKQGRFGDAEGAMKEALKLDPSVAQYHVGLAQAILKGRGAAGAAEARQALDQALALNPEHNAARLLKANALELEGDPKAALKLITDVLASDPSSAEAGREYRGLKERIRKSGEGKGLLGKLFKR
jgi:cytochrome c-type biogenesis protein CcmH/NrfG